jgi:dienelactone hydrolase
MTSGSWLPLVLRKVLVTGVLSLCVAAHPVAANQISVPSLVRFSADSPALPRGELVAELYRPATPRRAPAVVLMHGCGGWHGGVRHALASHARSLVAEGFVVLNLDSFGPRGSGNGEMCARNDLLREALRYRPYDAFAALRFLREQTFVDPDRVFLIGQSNGGSVALLAAQQGAARRYGRGESGFTGVVALYPWCGMFQGQTVSLEVPALVLVGGQDDWTPAEECLSFRSRGQPLQVHLFRNAAHSFDVMAPRHRHLGYLVGYDHEATTTSRVMIREFVRHPAPDRAIAVADTRAASR